MSKMQDSKTMRSSFSSKEAGAQGLSLIEHLEIQMDKRRKVLEEMLVEHGKEICDSNPGYAINRGRYEGIAASIAILRSSSIKNEIARSNGRLGI